MRDYESAERRVQDIQDRHPSSWFEVLPSGAPGTDVVLVHSTGSLDTEAVYQIPSTFNAALVAAFAFNDSATAILREVEGTDSSARIAELVGEKRQNYHGVLHGRGGSLDRVRRWIEHWNHQGMPPLRLVAGEGHARVIRVHPVTFTVTFGNAFFEGGLPARVQAIEALLARGVPGLGGVVRVGAEALDPGWDGPVQGWRVTYRSTADDPDRVVTLLSEAFVALGVTVERRS